jgi:hypothetical protein
VWWESFFPTKSISGDADTADQDAGGNTGVQHLFTQPELGSGCCEEQANNQLRCHQTK